MNLFEKTEKKLYKRQRRAARKELIRIAKNTNPWDWGGITNFIIAHLKSMRDYYALGYNVWGVEVKDTPEFNQPTAPTRLEICEHLLTLWHEYTDDSKLDDFMHTHPRPWNTETNTQFKTLYAEVRQYQNSKHEEFWQYFVQYYQDLWD